MSVKNAIVCESCGAIRGAEESLPVCPRCLLGGVYDPTDLSLDPSELPSVRPGANAAPFAPTWFGALQPPGRSIDGAVPRRQEEEKAPPPEEGQFEFRELIGIGGSGEVWKAVQTALGREVAVKRLHLKGAAGSPEGAACLLEAFRHEARITARLDHPNIVPVYDFGTDEEGRPLLAMKLVEGLPWSRRIRDDARLPLDERLEKHLPILLQVCKAVAFAHSRGVVHRDLKPGQIVIGAYGEVLLGDWGLGTAFRMESGRVVLEEGAVPNPAGTVAFMAPEQTGVDLSGIGPWTDVYLLGGILYYLLTDTPPHVGTEARAVLASAARGRVEPPETRSPGQEVPAELARIAMRALEPEAARRFPDVEAFAEAVTAWLGSTSARRESQALVAEAEEMLAASPGDYSVLQACEALLRTALGLWAENREGAALRDEVIARTVEAALKRDEFSVAESFAGRAQAASRRAELSQRIETALVRRRRRARLQRLLAVATLFLALAVGALGAYSWRARQHAAHQESEKRLAQELARQRIAEESARARLFADTNRLRAEETTLSEALVASLPYPTRLLYRDDPFAVRAENRVLIEHLLKETDRLRELRTGLVRRGMPLEPEPFGLLSGRTRLRLAVASDRGRGLEAYALAVESMTARPEDADGRLLAGIAAARAQCYTSATLHLRDAMLASIRTVGDDHPQTHR